MLIDTVAGIILSLGVAHIFEVPLSPWWLILGVAFALLPDIDFLIELVQRGTVGGKKLGAHRVLTHIPLLFLMPGILLYLFASPPLALLFLSCILWHFVHDIHAMGYGYRLLYPFFDKFYKFFSDKEGHYRYDFSHFVTSWTREEVEALHEKHGNDEWIRDHLRHHANKWQSSIVKLLHYCFILILILFVSRAIITL